MDARLYDAEWLRQAYIGEGWTEERIAAELGCQRTTVNKWLTRFAIPRRRPGTHFKGQAKSPEQREKMAAAARRRWAAHPATEELKDKIAAARRREGTRAGRPYIRVPGRGYVAEHVWIAEQNIGRRLLPGEHAHHKDFDPTNNAPDNIEVLTNAEHAALHAKRRERDATGRFK